jgi:hypothetical protein
MTDRPGGWPLPRIVVHCDWSTSPAKRWMAAAVLQDENSYLAYPAQPVPDPPSTLWQIGGQYLGPEPEGTYPNIPGALVNRLCEDNPTTDQASFLAGFDFPIGLPISYAHLVGEASFLRLLPELGRGEWADFYHPAACPSEIDLRRPYYPARPGNARQQHLTGRLGVNSMDALRRGCELPSGERRAACPLFWTMGAQQVGKAAISGWKDLLQPALQDGLLIWPFSGSLEDLLNRPGAVIAAETYPAEFYGHLGIRFGRGSSGGGKRSQTARLHQASLLTSWARRAGIQLHPALLTQIEAGFGESPSGEDPFDAVTGLFGMLNIVLGCRPPGEPLDPLIRQIEGWILGQETAV